MIDLLILIVLSVVFGLFVPVGFAIVAAAGLFVGLFFGGLSILLKLVPALVLVFAAPLFLSSRLSIPLALITLIISSGSLFVGYLAGSLIAVVLTPFKIFGNLLSRVFGRKK